MFYILHGEEEFVRSEQVAEFKARVAQGGMGDLNISTFSDDVTFQGLADACNTVPFFGDRRLIIVEDLLQHFDSVKLTADSKDGNAAYARKLLDYLPHLPSTTRLFFIENKKLDRNNPILKGAAELENSYVREFSEPEGRALQDWVRQRARDKGVDITGRGAALLASFVDQDLRRIDNELQKLAGFVNYERAITAEDVGKMVGASYEANIFKLVDALGMRQGKRALEHLHRLFADGAHELYILTMIARQVRLLIAVKDLAELGRLQPQEIRRELGISHQFIVDKLLRQARRFDMHRLETLQRHVLEVDRGLKTGRIESPLALELLVLEICSRGREKRSVG
ncbi:MAG: DNA polymerase III subunit delta [Chloroflexota bacterium]|nr:DNA polymerase III subunit delta [Chloroflexota bacterium]